MFKKIILIVLMFSLCVSNLVSQESNITSKHVFSIDTAPLLSGLMAGFVIGAVAGLGDSLSGVEPRSFGFGYGIGFGYEYIIDSFATIGLDADFNGIHFDDESVFLLSWNINSKFFFKKTGTPRGFFLKPMVGGQFGKSPSDSASYYATTIGLELGWRFLLSPETSKIKFLIDFSPVSFRYTYNHSDSGLLDGSRHDYGFGFLQTLAFTMMF